jgi:hypothetical protein
MRDSSSCLAGIGRRREDCFPPCFTWNLRLLLAVDQGAPAAEKLCVRADRGEREKIRLGRVRPQVPGLGLGPVRMDLIWLRRGESGASPIHRPGRCRCGCRTPWSGIGPGPVSVFSISLLFSLFFFSVFCFIFFSFCLFSLFKLKKSIYEKCLNLKNVQI